MDSIKTVLAISPHADDSELGAGGLLHRLAKSGASVSVIVMTKSDGEYQGGMQNECRRSLSALGIHKMAFWEFPNKQLPDFRMDILANLDRLGTYDLVLVPATWDTHQDHQTVTREAMRAFKRCRILGYEFPWNSLTDIRLTTFVPLSEEELNKKLEALACYRSQQHQPYFDPEYVKGLARVRGVQIAMKYAEAFETIRFILR